MALYVDPPVFGPGEDERELLAGEAVLNVEMVVLEGADVVAPSRRPESNCGGGLGALCGWGGNCRETLSSESRRGLGEEATQTAYPRHNAIDTRSARYSATASPSMPRAQLLRGALGQRPGVLLDAGRSGRGPRAVPAQRRQARCGEQGADAVLAGDAATGEFLAEGDQHAPLASSRSVLRSDEEKVVSVVHGMSGPRRCCAWTCPLMNNNCLKHRQCDRRPQRAPIIRRGQAGIEKTERVPSGSGGDHGVEGRRRC
jgi:hypothetical protein